MTDMQDNAFLEQIKNLNVKLTYGTINHSGDNQERHIVIHFIADNDDQAFSIGSTLTDLIHTHYKYSRRDGRSKWFLQKEDLEPKQYHYNFDHTKY